MNKQKTIKIEKNCFNVPLTLDCGQSFRWVKTQDGGMHGVAYGRALTVYEDEKFIMLVGADEKDFNDIWKSYFDLETDYVSICEKLKKDPYLKSAIDKYYGIRILRQEPWETLCSFIISQNNNIPRIKGIIHRLCENFGEDLGNGDHTFPTPEKILEAGADELGVLRAGFRTKYIIDAAEKVVNGEVDFDYIQKSTPEDGAQMLKKIKGVGDKVSACVLLYGFGKHNVVPVDVWVKRILEETYPNGLPECTQGVKGIAQQYLFHYKRNEDK